MQFSDAIPRSKRVAREAEENAKKDARADVQKRRVERCVVGRYPEAYSPTFCRIWEKLSEEGWHEEITVRKSKYEPRLTTIRGVAMARPLSKTGTHTPDPLSLVT